MGTPADCSYSDKCYRYIPEADTWEETGSMSGKKRGQAADYTDSLGLAMAYFDDPLEVTGTASTSISWPTIPTGRRSSGPTPDASWR